MLRRFFSWLFSLFSSRSQTDIYKPGERLIYRYSNGQKTITADPLTLYKRVMDVGPYLSIDMKVAQSISKDAGKAHNEMILRVRGIFNVEPLEKGGLTELETLQLLDHFLEYCERIKKNSRQFVTSSTSSAVSPITSEKASLPMSNSSDSGSTANAPSTDVPLSSLMEQESRLEPSNPV